MVKPLSETELQYNCQGFKILLRIAKYDLGNNVILVYKRSPNNRKLLVVPSRIVCN